MLADVPGLIEGAAEGAGLGHLFLRHLSRTKILLHMIDAAPFNEETDPVQEAKALVLELEKYDPALAAKPRWIVLNKIDLVEEADRDALIERYRSELAANGEPIFVISAATRQGCEELVKALAQRIDDDRRRHPLRSCRTLRNGSFPEETRPLLRAGSLCFSRRPDTAGGFLSIH